MSKRDNGGHIYPMVLPGEGCSPGISRLDALADNITAHQSGVYMLTELNDEIMDKLTVKSYRLAEKQIAAGRRRAETAAKIPLEKAGRTPPKLEVEDDPHNYTEEVHPHA